jgi:tetratricopeptide (TPR) repeat protein
MRRVLLLVTLAAVLSPAARALAQPPGQTNANAERARAHYISGWQHMSAERFDEAAGEFRAAIDLNAKYELAYYGLGRAYLALHRYTARAVTCTRPSPARSSIARWTPSGTGRTA